MRQEAQTGLNLRPPGDLQLHGGAMIEQDMAGAQDTIYLCNFRVSVDGEWLCLKELQDVEFTMQDSMQSPSPPLAISGINNHRLHRDQRYQEATEQSELYDILPLSPPPIQHFSSLCLYLACTHLLMLMKVFMG